MAYKLYTDKSNVFECKLQLEGASLKNAKVRLIAETSTKSLLFKGNITVGGHCEIPIDKLRGIFEENTKGTLRLEVIAEDTYFDPWSSPFVVIPSKRLRVEVASQKRRAPKRPQMVVNVMNPDQQKLNQLTNEIVKSLRRKHITAENISQPNTKKYVSRFIQEAVVRTGESVDTHLLITKVVNKLAK